MNAFTQTGIDLAAALMGKPLVDPKPEETIADFVRFVRAHPSNPYPNIGWGMTLCDVEDNEPVSLVKARLSRQIVVWKGQIVGKHWAANPTKLRCACLLLDLLDEFEGTA